MGRYPKGAVLSGTLAYAHDPVKLAERFENDTQGSKDVVLMIRSDVAPPPVSCAVLRVPDVSKAANTVARKRRDAFNGAVIAVTGSMGKTTVTSMLNATLSRQHTVFSPRSDKNGMASMRSRALRLGNEDYAVLEVPRAVLPGAEQILGPDVAVITAIAEAHMEAFGSLRETAQTKATLLEGLSEEGVAVINIDAPHSEILMASANKNSDRVITYGVARDADIRLSDYDAHSRQVTAVSLDRTLKYTLGASGKHNALNSLAVLGVIEALGLDVQEHLQGLADFRAVEGRGEVTVVERPLRRLTVVDQTFNANPASVRAAMTDFAEQYSGSHRILALGDMLELGPNEAELHAELSPAIAASEPDKVYLVGPLMVNAWKALPDKIRGAHVMTPEQLIALLQADIREDAAVLLKASHGTGLNRVAEAMKSTNWRLA
ncbi:UDP-N-acetylmuramoyl-tripeptide--D-alanyl-D-alanine ligase [Nesterenkonia sphaerica]|uniref:UDP-N-acetylmuramoyl-tripeptide--D-alanyl-D- alanine ligase n=1 Tax=Nesterenkonia sphaerica TaxID=1804988 RepID=UPI001407BDA7|nr:UDP-N-acetylmuramoyl-tripeptide--D-alanyl-D-alanine ligase [Nesterenkonia sphaerica]